MCEADVDTAEVVDLASLSESGIAYEAQTAFLDGIGMPLGETAGFAKEPVASGQVDTVYRDKYRRQNSL